MNRFLVGSMSTAHGLRRTVAMAVLLISALVVALGIYGCGRSSDGTARLREKLEAWAASADPLPSQLEPYRKRDTLEKLRSLGYIK